MSKPFHLMTPRERTLARIAENRAITEKIANTANNDGRPTHVSSEGVRMTPEERAKRGGLIRKVPK
jgi:hypothetical protein